MDYSKLKQGVDNMSDEEKAVGVKQFEENAHSASSPEYKHKVKDQLKKDPFACYGPFGPTQENNDMFLEKLNER